jgi:hypothetical protein
MVNVRYFKFLILHISVIEISDTRMNWPDKVTKLSTNTKHDTLSFSCCNFSKEFRTIRYILSWKLFNEADS